MDHQQHYNNMYYQQQYKAQGPAKYPAAPPGYGYPSPYGGGYGKAPGPRLMPGGAPGYPGMEQEGGYGNGTVPTPGAQGAVPATGSRAPPGPPPPGPPQGAVNPPPPHTNQPSPPSGHPGQHQGQHPGVPGAGQHSAAPGGHPGSQHPGAGQHPGQHPGAPGGHPGNHPGAQGTHPGHPSAQHPGHPGGAPPPPGIVHPGGHPGSLPTHPGHPSAQHPGHPGAGGVPPVPPPGWGYTHTKGGKPEYAREGYPLYKPNHRVVVPALFPGGKLGLNLRGVTIENFYNAGAEKLGWKYDDIIVAVNGTPISTFDEFSKVMAHVKATDNLPIIFDVYRPDKSEQNSEASSIQVECGAVALCSHEEYVVMKETAVYTDTGMKTVATTIPKNQRMFIQDLKLADNAIHVYRTVEGQFLSNLGTLLPVSLPASEKGEMPTLLKGLDTLRIWRERQREKQLKPVVVQ